MCPGLRPINFQVSTSRILIFLGRRPGQIFALKWLNFRVVDLDHLIEVFTVGVGVSGHETPTEIHIYPLCPNSTAYMGI